MILTNDIIGVFKRTTYGQAGDSVKIVADHGAVMIVEDQKGSRFPVARSELIIGDSGAAGITPAAPVKVKSARKESLPKKTSERPGQKNLF